MAPTLPASARRRSGRIAAAAATAAAHQTKLDDDMRLAEGEEDNNDEGKEDDDIVDVEKERDEYDKNNGRRRRSRSRSRNRKDAHNDDDNDYDEDDDEEKDETKRFEMDGKEYKSYAAMVQAKRERNQEMLRRTGLLDLQAPRPRRRTPAYAKKHAEESTSRRKSNRLAGVEAEDTFVENEYGGRFQIRTVAKKRGEDKGEEEAEEAEEEESFRNRIGNGADLTVGDALRAVEGQKENVDDDDLDTGAVHFMRKTLPQLSKANTANGTKTTRTTTATPQDRTLQDRLDGLSVECTEKVVPNRIYSIACHPSPSALLVAAGDRQGYVGIWNVDGHRPEEEELPKATSSPTAVVPMEEEQEDSVKQTAPPRPTHQNEHGGNIHCFRVHGASISCMEWHDNSSLLTSSYDSSLRLWDVESCKFRQVFATFPNDDSVPSTTLGHGLDVGRHFWIQYVASDTPQPSCYFLSTSLGELWHVDLRANALSFRHQLSDKKINSVSLHPNGTTVATAGLDYAVRWWDVRKWSANNKTKKPKVHALGMHQAPKSISSAFFSPSGRYLLCTTMANQLNIVSPFDEQSSKPKTIPHNTSTGRWLSTFQARWHASLDVFVVGSLKKPRSMDVFSAPNNDDNGFYPKVLRGDALTAVASRCCFHPNSDLLMVAGGNSSGRVTIAR